MAGEIQIGGTTFATESGGTVTVSNVDSATNRQNLGLEIGVDVQAFDTDTTKNDVANTFTANQTISVTDNTNAALRVTQLGTGNALVVEDSTNPDSTPFVVDASGNVGIGTTPTAKLSVNGGIVVDSDVFNRLQLLDTTNSDVPFVVSAGSSTATIGNDVNTATGSEYIQLRSSNELRFGTSGTRRMSIDSSGITHFNNGTIASGTITIADDAVGTIAIPNQSWTGGVAIVGVNTRSNFPFFGGAGIFYFDCGNSLGMSNLSTLGATFTTGSMTGTTGSDGTTNYSVVNSPSKALLIENRDGSTLTYSYLIIQ